MEQAPGGCLKTGAHTGELSIGFLCCAVVWLQLGLMPVDQCIGSWLATILAHWKLQLATLQSPIWQSVKALHPPVLQHRP